MNSLKRLAQYAPWFGAALVALAVVEPHLAFAQAGTLPTGFQIVPAMCNCVQGAGWGCVLGLVKNLFQFVIYLGLLACLVGIVWAGYEWVLSPISSGNRQKGRAIFTNAIIGLVIVLGAYLLVNTVFTVLTNGTLNSYTAVFGSTSGNCLAAASNPTATNGTTQGLGANATASGPLQNGSGACNATQVQNAATSAGIPMSTAEAETFACLANPESSCGQNTTGAKQSNGTPTSAAGPWQNLLGGTDQCHSLDIPACGNLNCSAAYSGGKVKSDAASQALAAQCQAEINNLTCAVSAAACLAKADGGYTAWTGTGDGYTHSAQTTCVSEYPGNNPT